jgi:hypothetical protein
MTPFVSLRLFWLGATVCPARLLKGIVFPPRPEGAPPAAAGQTASRQVKVLDSDLDPT